MTRVGRALWRLLGGHVDDGLTPPPPFEPPDGWVVVYDGDAESAVELALFVQSNGGQARREHGVVAVPDDLAEWTRSVIEADLQRWADKAHKPDDRRTVAQFATRREVETAVAELEAAALRPTVIELDDDVFGGPAFVVRVRERNVAVAADLLRAIAEEHPWFRPLDLPPDR